MLVLQHVQSIVRTKDSPAYTCNGARVHSHGQRHVDGCNMHFGLDLLEHTEYAFVHLEIALWLNAHKFDDATISLEAISFQQAGRPVSVDEAVMGEDFRVGVEHKLAK